MRLASTLSLIFFGALVACNALVGFGTLEKIDAVESRDGGGGSSSSSSSSSSSGEVSEGGTTQEGGPINAKCDPKKQFKAPVKLPGPINSGSHETMPSLTADELTIFFQRTVGLDGGNILMATRSSINDPFGDPIEVTQATGGTGGSYAPTVTGDGLSLFWSEVISGNFQIYHSTRATKTSAWTARQEMVKLNTNNEETYPFITSDGSELYFTSDRSNVRRIYRSKREPSGGDYLAPNSVPELNAQGAGEMGFTLSADGLIAYVGSDRTGTLGGIDIFRYERASTTATFAPGFVNVPELNSPQQDWPGWISPDNCRFYFGSLRVNPGELYMASRDP